MERSSLHWRQSACEDFPESKLEGVEKRGQLCGEGETGDRSITNHFFCLP